MSCRTSPRCGPWVSLLLHRTRLRLGEGGGHPGVSCVGTDTNTHAHRHPCCGHTRSPPKQASVQMWSSLHLGFRARPRVKGCQMPLPPPTHTTRSGVGSWLPRPRLQICTTVEPAGAGAPEDLKLLSLAENWLQLRKDSSLACSCPRRLGERKGPPQEAPCPIPGTPATRQRPGTALLFFENLLCAHI